MNLLLGFRWELKVDSFPLSALLCGELKVDSFPLSALLWTGPNLLPVARLWVVGVVGAPVALEALVRRQDRNWGTSSS